MKKLFYIVLVIVALMVISRFIKENTPIAPTTTVETSEPVTATLPDTNCICDSQPSCDSQDNNCDEDKLKTICRCQQANGEMITIEQDVEEVVEMNPDETSDEDETFVEENTVSETEANKKEPSTPAEKTVEEKK